MTKPHKRWFEHEPIRWRYVPRRDMPQIDKRDMPALLGFLQTIGVKVTRVTADPASLTFRQHVNAKLVASVSGVASEYGRPILTSSDGSILDGDHRAMAHLRRSEPVQCLQLGLPFAKAVRALFRFPRTYDYAKRDAALVAARSDIRKAVAARD